MKYLYLVTIFGFLLMGTTPEIQAQDKELSLMAPYVLEGKWTGHLTQEVGGLAREYYYQIEITLEGNKIKAKGFIKEQNMEGYFDMKGNYSGTTIQLSDLTITKQQLPEKSAWCIKQMELQLIFKDGAFCLKGDWAGTVPWGECSPGTIFLTKDTIRA